jgi:hypothetical protein
MMDSMTKSWTFRPRGRKKCVVSLILVKKVSYSFFVQRMFKNCRCPKSQPLEWNVLDDGFNDEKLDICHLGLGDERNVEKSDQRVGLVSNVGLDLVIHLFRGSGLFFGRHI